FLASRRWHTRSKRDWSSDVCSSDLGEIPELKPKKLSKKKKEDFEGFIQPNYNMYGGVEETPTPEPEQTPEVPEQPEQPEADQTTANPEATNTTNDESTYTETNIEGSLEEESNLE